MFSPFAHISIRSATEFFFPEKTPKANPFALFSVKLFKFELGMISNICSGIYDSALGINERHRFFGLRSTKIRKFPWISRVQLWQFQFRFENRISLKIFSPFAHISIRFATEFFFPEKTPKANPVALFSVKLFKFELGIISNI